MSDEGYVNDGYDDINTKSSSMNRALTVVIKMVI